MLKSRLKQGKEDLDKAIAYINELCELVMQPKSIDDYFHYFVYDDRVVPEEEQMAESIKRMSLRENFYDACRSLTRKYLAIATEMPEAGYTEQRANEIDLMVRDYDKTMHAIMLRSGDQTDLGQYESEMRALLDRYVSARPSDVLATLDEISFLDFIDKKKPEEFEIVAEVGGEHGVSEIIVSNVRRVINRKHDQNPEEYERFSERLNRLLLEMREGTQEYKVLLQELIRLAMEVRKGNNSYPTGIDTDGKKALYDNLGKDAELVQVVYDTVKATAQTNWRTVDLRRKLLKREVQKVLPEGYDIDMVMGILTSNSEF